MNHKAFYPESTEAAVNDIQAEFKRWQNDGYLGDPQGEDAYGYGRASSERQVEEGSSFPRQIEHIHKAAVRDGLRIPFDHLFFDDGFTGFEFEHRPALIKLRKEIATKPRAAHLVIEDIDRLSRNSDWQQGYLLDEIARHKITVHFFVSPGSNLERYVRGYIAQEGMKKDIERMRMGTVYKAMDGRVTAKRPRYGYKITNPKESHYELIPEEAAIVRTIFVKIIYAGWTAKAVARWLNDNRVPTRYTSKAWDASAICTIVKCPVYKGEFYANREVMISTGKYTASGRPAKKTLIRPQEEWIKVAVPIIVTPQEWDQAQEALKKNSVWHLRNGKIRGWLLQGMLLCQTCNKFTMRAITRKTDWRVEEYRYYICGSKYNERARVDGSRCRNPFVRADKIETQVWEKIQEVIYNPDVIIRRLEDRADAAHVAALQEQVDYIDRQVDALEKERCKLEAAYNADIYDLAEFKSKMADLKERQKGHEISRSKLQVKMAEQASLADQKRVVIAALRKLQQQLELARREQRPPREVPFELKRNILTLLVDTILVDAVNRTFTIKGETKGTYALDDEPAENGTGGHGGIPKTSAPGSRTPRPGPAISRASARSRDSPPASAADQTPWRAT